MATINPFTPSQPSAITQADIFNIMYGPPQGSPSTVIAPIQNSGPMVAAASNAFAAPPTTEIIPTQQLINQRFGVDPAQDIAAPTTLEDALQRYNQSNFDVRTTANYIRDLNKNLGLSEEQLIAAVPVFGDEHRQHFNSGFTEGSNYEGIASNVIRDALKDAGQTQLATTLEKSFAPIIQQGEQNAQARWQATQQDDSGWGGGIGGLLGTIAGIALAPYTGGASLALMGGLGAAAGQTLGSYATGGGFNLGNALKAGALGALGGGAYGALGAGAGAAGAAETAGGLGAAEAAGGVGTGLADTGGISSLVAGSTPTVPTPTALSTVAKLAGAPAEIVSALNNPFVSNGITSLVRSGLTGQSLEGAVKNLLFSTVGSSIGTGVSGLTADAGQAISKLSGTVADYATQSALRGQDVNLQDFAKNYALSQAGNAVKGSLGTSLTDGTAAAPAQDTTATTGAPMDFSTYDLYGFGPDVVQPDINDLYGGTNPTGVTGAPMEGTGADVLIGDLYGGDYPPGVTGAPMEGTGADVLIGDLYGGANPPGVTGAIPATPAQPSNSLTDFLKSIGALKPQGGLTGLGMLGGAAGLTGLLSLLGSAAKPSGGGPKLPQYAGIDMRKYAPATTAAPTVYQPTYQDYRAQPPAPENTITAADGGLMALGHGTGNVTVGADPRRNPSPLSQDNQNNLNWQDQSEPLMRMAAGGGISSLGSYSDGGRLLKGPGDGMSDHIPATIGDKQPARLADGEFVIPADVVSHLGNGSTDAGANVLYGMMNRIRKARTGNPKQGKQINPSKFTPA